MSECTLSTIIAQCLVLRERHMENSVKLKLRGIKVGKPMVLIALIYATTIL